MTTVIDGSLGVLFPDAGWQTKSAGNVIAVSVYSNAATTLWSGIWTKVIFHTEEFDITDCYDLATTNRFQPDMAGYYSINACVGGTNTSANISTAIYKNGTRYKYNGYTNSLSSNSVSALVFLNGTTDYVELYARSSGSQNTNIDSSATWFQGILLKRS